MSWYIENAEDVAGRPTKERPKQRKGKPTTRYGQAAFENWSSLLSRKGESLQRALGTRIGRILGCGYYGCTVESSAKKVIKLSPLPEGDSWDDDEELKFWTKMKSEQRRPKSPASEGVVKIDHVWVVTDEQTDEKYMVVLRDAVDPFINVIPDPVFPERNKLVPAPKTAEWGLARIPTSRPDDLTEELKYRDGASAVTISALENLLDPVLRATNEYRLGDVHLGNIGWHGGGLVIYDADYKMDAPGPDKQLRVNREGKHSESAKRGYFWEWDEYLERKGDALAQELGVPLKGILGCGMLGCVVESSPGKVVKLTSADAHRSHDMDVGEELAFWTHIKSEQRDPDSPASRGVVRVYDVSVVEDKETGDKFVAVVREAVTPAATSSEWTPLTARRVCGTENCTPLPWYQWPQAANAVSAIEAYSLDDVHRGNIGWRGDELVVFDAHADVQYLEPDEMKQMRVNREREVQERGVEYEPTFNEWSRLIADKGDSLQQALGAKVGRIIGCGAFGCVTASEPGKVIKLSSFRAHGGGDEELSFWTKMKAEQKRPNSPASKGVVKIDQIALVTDNDTGEEYIAVLRDDVEPLLTGDGVPSNATTSRLSPDAVKMLRATWHWEGIPAAAGAREAVEEYGLNDVHAGNLGWSGDRLVVYDGHARDEPEDEDIDLRLRVNDGYSPFHEHLPGGLAAGLTPDDFDPEQLARGIGVELEHTQDVGIATEIAMDHLVEDPMYYEKLNAMEMNARRRVHAPKTPPKGQRELLVDREGGEWVVIPDSPFLEIEGERYTRDWVEQRVGPLRPKLTENARAFYVFEMSGQKPLRQVNVKPLTLAKAKQLARIGAQNGKHDRAVTTDPRKEDFRIVGGYEAGHGK